MTPPVYLKLMLAQPTSGQKPVVTEMTVEEAVDFFDYNDDGLSNEETKDLYSALFNANPSATFNKVLTIKGRETSDVPHDFGSSSLFSITRDYAGKDNTKTIAQEDFIRVLKGMEKGYDYNDLPGKAYLGADEVFEDILKGSSLPAVNNELQELNDAYQSGAKKEPSKPPRYGNRILGLSAEALQNPSFQQPNLDEGFTPDDYENINPSRNSSSTTWQSSGNYPNPNKVDGIPAKQVPKPMEDSSSLPKASTKVDLQNTNNLIEDFANLGLITNSDFQTALQNSGLKDPTNILGGVLSATQTTPGALIEDVRAKALAQYLVANCVDKNGNMEQPTVEEQGTITNILHFISKEALIKGQY